MELGGKCPLIVDESAIIDFASTKVAFGKTLNSGQICIAPDYVFVHESKIKDFVKACEAKFKAFYGDNEDGSEIQGHMINDFHCQRVAELLKTAGGTVICGGKVNFEAKHV